MFKQDLPFISAQQRLPEMTIKAVCLGILLACVLTVSNTYLALKIGILTSASIPAAVLSMAVLRLFKHSTVLENNLVQTAASASEAIAGGIAYTAPALIITHFWHHFAYWENVGIALLGGMLGVLFSIPLRRLLVADTALPFPEGRAIAEVLKIEAKKETGIKEMIWGGAIGALLESAQSGFQIIANSAQYWRATGSTLWGGGLGFSVTLLSAGYLIGANIGCSIFVGACVGWLLGVPVLTTFYEVPIQGDVTQTVMAFWDTHIRYIGIGAMLMAGLWTMASLIRPLLKIMWRTMEHFLTRSSSSLILRTERDLPLPYVVAGIVICFIGAAILFQQGFSLGSLGFHSALQLSFILICLACVLILGFISVLIASYFSGLVGVNASPGSGIILGALLLLALFLRAIFSLYHPLTLDQATLLHLSAIVLILNAVTAGAAAIANDNIQDLKVGHLLGATPWKQQLMLMLGVVVASLVIPWVMELLFNVYGIGTILPHAGMDPSKALAAPPAAMMAALAQAVFHHDLPWHFVYGGAMIILVFVLLNRFLKRTHRLSLLGVAIGIYLPLVSSIPLFIGGMIAWGTRRCLQRNLEKDPRHESRFVARAQRGILLACGLLAGAALMDVCLSVPFAIASDPNVLRITSFGTQMSAIGIAFCMLLGLGGWFYSVVARRL